MKGANESSQETRMVRSRPWSTFPQSRSFTRTLRPSVTPCRDASCPGRPITQRQYVNPSEALHSRVVPEQIATSMSIVLGRTNSSLDERDEQIHALASFFASSISKTAKLKRLRILVALVTPEEALWQLRESILRDTLRFLTCRTFDWPHEEHTAHVLLLELRAMCLYEIERQSLIIQTSQVAAGCIFGAARLVEAGLTCSVPVIHFGLDLAGNQAKRYMTPAAIPSTPSHGPTRNQIVTRTYTNVAKRATGGLLVTTKTAATSIRDASTDRIHYMAQRMEQEQWGQHLIPHERHRNVLVAVGTVGIASLGAAAIVGEALVSTTASVAIKSAEVTASVVRHKYGEHAGQVVEDASQTTGNILGATAALALLETSVLARSVAKNTIKEQATRIHEGEEESTIDNDNDDLLAALKAGNFESRLQKIESQASFGVNRDMDARPPAVSTMIRIESESNDPNVQMKGGPNSD